MSKPEELTHLSPIENAIETMQKANDDLRTLIMKHFNPPQEPPLYVTYVVVTLSDNNFIVHSAFSEMS